MHPILFYGVPSGCSFGSIVALEWLGEPYQLCRIAMPEDVTSDAYKRINPLAETPSLMTHESKFISESMAILNHIGARGIDKRLGFAQGTPYFDQLNQILAFLNTSFFNAFSPLWHILEHATGGAEKIALTDYGRHKVAKAHVQLETLLGNSEWLMGDHRTLADAYFIGIARWNEYHQVIERKDFPNIERLYKKLETDPAVIFAHAIEQQTQARTAGGFKGHINVQEALKNKIAL